MHKNIENVSESAVDRSPERSGTDRQRIETGRTETNERINALVRTNTPEGGDKSKDEKKKTGGEDKHETPSGDKHEGSNVRHNDAGHDGPPEPTKESKNFARNSAIGLTAAGAAAVALSPATIAQIPLIGKIPYLPQAAAALKAGISNMVAPLGLGTGANATNWVMASIPYTGVGTALAAGLAIPAGLWSVGMIKSFITGQKYGGLMGNIKEAGRTIVGAPFYAYNKIMMGRYRAGKFAKKTWDTATAPIRGTWNLGSKIVKGTWKGAKSATTAALSPTWSGGVGAGIGTVLGVMGAPATGGASLIASPLLGYAAGNMFKNSGSLNPAMSAASHGH